MTDLTPQIARPPPRTRVLNDTALRGGAQRIVLDLWTDISYTLNALAGREREDCDDPPENSREDENAPAPLSSCVCQGTD